MAPALVLAQSGAPRSILTLLQTLCRIVGWAFAVLMFLAVIMVIYAAFLYLTAAGDPEKVKKANATILYAAIAIAVALLAKFLPDIVASTIDVNINSYGGGWQGCP